MIATEEEVSGTLVIQIAGSALDAETSKHFRKEIKDKLQGRRQVVLDLSELVFVDSSGLGVLIACLRQVSAAGGDLKLCGLSAQVRTLFELVRMHRLFSIFNSRDEAMRAFR
jgi:anti-sigma B factor antagonist